VNFECAQCVLFVCGQKDYVRELLSWHRAQNLETIHSRHLHIQEDQVGRKFEYFLDRGHAIPALPDDLDILELPQSENHPAAGQWLVIHDQR
jgi:hypothetical protein